MYLIDLIFELVGKWVPIDQNKYKQLYQEANTWQSLGEDKPIKRLYDKIHKPWGVRLLIAVMYIPLTKWIISFMRDDSEDDGTVLR
ncbi:MAG: hypothetical protein K9J13_13830 [Saprospiraceae bacterium]|nr:hypothetical protein [Saprospiraceae bacterium]